MSYGIKIESQVAKKLRDEGYTVIRSAASKVVDLIVYNNRSKTWIVEVKATRKTTPVAYTSVIREMRKHGNRYRRPVLYIYIRGKVLWFWCDTMQVDKKRTTYDMTKAEKWASRRRRSINDKT